MEPNEGIKMASCPHAAPNLSAVIPGALLEGINNVHILFGFKGKDFFLLQARDTIIIMQ